jgi:AraC-like DNA-binding protein
MARINTKDLSLWHRAAEESGYHAGKVAISLGISRRQLYRYTIATFGRSPQEWLNDVRLTTAGQLLMQTRYAKLVAFDLGFKQLSHFSREFKRFYGVTPTLFLTWADSQEPAHWSAASTAQQKSATKRSANGQ